MALKRNFLRPSGLGKYTLGDNDKYIIMEKKKCLEELKRKVEDCRDCPLGRSRKHPVFGEGDVESKVVFIGEAPGYYEDQIGKPFVGRAGSLLDNLLDEIGLSRNSVYIANVLKCRPPGNRDPLPEEIDACKPYLMEQLKIIQPLIICTLGKFALVSIYNKSASITALHGRLIQMEKFNIFPLYHPAAALHQPMLLDSIKEDFAKLKEQLTKPIPEIIPDLKTTKTQEEKIRQEQMKLF